MDARSRSRVFCVGSVVSCVSMCCYIISAHNVLSSLDCLSCSSQRTRDIKSILSLPTVLFAI